MRSGSRASGFGLRPALILLAACGHPAPPPTPPTVAPDAAIPLVAPTLRLPHDIVPRSTGYDLHARGRPKARRPDFKGEVAIHARVAATTDRLWLHAVDLDIASARLATGGTLEPLAAGSATDPSLHGFKLPRVVAAGSELVLDLDYSGHTTGDQQGLFRQSAAGRWYLYAQSESVFARRIVPCFDEPGFKAPWTVTLVVPDADVALANAPEVHATPLDGGRRRVAFAPTTPIPSYLLAIAVGPFEVVDAGKVGRNAIPLRVVVPAGDRDRAGLPAAWTGKLVAALEAYFDAPIPVAKLDFVAVPEFFGAMENPGLVMFVASLLLGDGAAAGQHFARVAAHELAHQWLGNLVTPPWWDDLWLSEASASWLGDKVAGELGAFDDPQLRTALARADALAADAEPGRLAAVHRRVERGDDPEAGFGRDRLRHKGAAVLAMIERTAGAGADARRRARLRARPRRRRRHPPPDLRRRARRRRRRTRRMRSRATSTTPARRSSTLELRCDGRAARRGGGAAWRGGGAGVRPLRDAGPARRTRARSSTVAASSRCADADGCPPVGDRQRRRRRLLRGRVEQRRRRTDGAAADADPGRAAGLRRRRRGGARARRHRGHRRARRAAPARRRSRPVRRPRRDVDRAGDRAVRRRRDVRALGRLPGRAVQPPAHGGRDARAGDAGAARAPRHADRARPRRPPARGDGATGAR